MTKKILAMILASAMVLSLAGCQENNGGGDSGNNGGGDSSNNGGDSGNNGGGDSNNGGDDSNGGGSSDGFDYAAAAEEEGVLSIVSWSNNTDVQNMIKIFCKETGISEDKIVFVPQGDSGGDGSKQIAQYLSGNEDADILTLEADWILRYINDDALTAPLSTVNIKESDLADPYAYTVAIGKNEKGDFMGASFQAAPGGFCYNAKLAEEYLGVKTPEEMQAKIKDWDSFKATAKEVYEASEGKCSLTATEGGLWQVYQANRTQPWVKDDTLIMDNAEAFYDIAKEMKDNGYMADVAQWDAAWWASVQDGTAMGDFVSTWGAVATEGTILTNFSGTEESVSYGNMAFCEGPSSYFWGGTWLGVAKKCNNPKLAEAFIRFFTCDATGMEKYSLETGDFCNNSTVMKKIVDEGTNKNALLKDGQDQFAIFLPQAAGIKMDGLITKYDTDIKDAFNKSVQDYIAGTLDSKEAAIEQFKNDVAEKFDNLTID